VYDADPALKGRYAIADNGGANLVYWTGPASGKAAEPIRVPHSTTS